MAFKPKSKSSFKKVIKKHLLDGDIIRYDFRDEKPIEVMVRDAIGKLPYMHNIGMEDNAVIETIFCDHDIVHEVVNELSTDYSISKIHCAYSGCCQYTTYGIYIDGE